MNVTEKTRYRVNVGLTYFVDANDEDEAEDIAYGIAHLDFGNMVKNMWFDVEESWG